MRQLKRILQRLNLRCRVMNLYTPLGYGQGITETRTLCWLPNGMAHHNMNVKRDDAMDIMKALNPNSVILQTAHLLK